MSKYTRQLAYAKRNKEKINEYKRTHKPSIASKMIARAKDRGKFEVSLTNQDILNVWPKDNYCPILGLEMVVGNEGGRENSPSLDRIDSSKGYTKDNIQIISCLANRMKDKATNKQLVTFAKWILKTHPEST